MANFPPSASRRLLRGVAAGLVAVAAASVLAACSSGNPSAGPASSLLTNQTWLVPQDWGSIDPTKVTATNTGAILLVLEPLVLADPSGGVTSNLATQSRPNDTTYTYTLRKGARFSDGKPVSIQDVAYSFKIQSEKGSTSTLAGNFADVKSMTVSGDAFTIALNAPNVEFQTTVAETGIVEKSVREKLGSGAGSPDKPNVGSGPYTVETYKPGAELVLKRNPDYWGKKPVAATLTLKLVQDDSARLLAVQSGNVTGAFEIPASETDTYAKAPGMKVITGENPSIMLFNVNTADGPWKDLHVRQAVAAAIDKAGIVKSVLKGQGSVASAIVPEGKAEQVMSADAAKTLYASLATKHSLSDAKADLAKSAYPTGFSATVVYSQAEEGTSGLVAQAVAASLKPLGITLTVQSLPDSQYTDQVFFKHTAPASIVDFTTDSPDPISLPNYLSNSSGLLANGGYTNIADYSNTAQDTTINSYLATPSTDKSKRAALLAAALTQLKTDQAYIPVYNSKYLAVVKKGISFKDFDGFWWQRRWIDEVTATN